MVGLPGRAGPLATVSEAVRSATGPGAARQALGQQPGAAGSGRVWSAERFPCSPGAQHWRAQTPERPLHGQSPHSQTLQTGFIGSQCCFRSVRSGKRRPGTVLRASRRRLTRPLRPWAMPTGLQCTPQSLTVHAPCVIFLHDLKHDSQSAFPPVSCFLFAL